MDSKMIIIFLTYLLRIKFVLLYAVDGFYFGVRNFAAGLWTNIW